MQELDVQPTNPTPYTPAGGTYNNNPTPGAGGLPSLSGLSNRMNPMAQELQQQGRGDDSMLVHMTPGEVNSLRGLAQKFGGDLTTNPSTGLPEAGWLGKLLPTLIGAAGMLIPGVAPWMLAAGVGAGQAALTGDLNKGLMAGLQAFGGASLAGAAGVGGGASSAIAPVTDAASTATSGLANTAGAAANPLAVTNGAIGSASNLTGLGSTIPAGIDPALGAINSSLGLGGNAASAAGNVLGSVANPMNLPAVEGAINVTGQMPALGAPAAKTGLAGFAQQFGQTAAEGLPSGMLSKYAPYAAGLGTLSAVSDATAPDLKKYEREEDKWNYEGSYYPMPRRISPRATGPEGEGEISFFDVTNPVGYLTATGERRGYAEGGAAKGSDKSMEGDFDPSAFDPTKFTQKQLTQGMVDPNTGFRTGLSHGSTLKQMGLGAGTTSNLGDKRFVLNENYEWEYAPLPAAPATGGDDKPLVSFPQPNTGGGGGVTPGGGTGATLTTPTMTPGATQSGFGVETLGSTYTPNFTPKDDYTTPKNAPYTLGSQMTAALPGLTSQFRTSPGAVTASRGYEGGSPSERIRAMAQANAAARGDAVKPATEIDFGLPKTSAINAMAPAASGLPDFTNMTPQDIFNYYNSPGAFSGLNRARGGSVNMDDGSFVIDARTVSELGNGSSNAGIEFLESLGGRAVRGPGDGVSDSVPANIGGTQEARVARDEVIFPAAVVKKLGGAKKLYALMDKAHAARKKAKRGQDTKVRKGLA